jgi:hypothetical protein
MKAEITLYFTLSQKWPEQHDESFRETSISISGNMVEIRIGNFPSTSARPYQSCNFINKDYRKITETFVEVLLSFQTPMMTNSTIDFKIRRNVI